MNILEPCVSDDLMNPTVKEFESGWGLGHWMQMDKSKLIFSLFWIAFFLFLTNIGLSEISTFSLLALKEKENKQKLHPTQDLIGVALH